MEQVLERLEDNFEVIINRELEKQRERSCTVKQLEVKEQIDTKIPYVQRLKKLHASLTVSSQYIWVHISCFIWHSCLTTMRQAPQSLIPRRFLEKKVADLSQINLSMLKSPVQTCSICEKKKGLMIRCPGNPK